MSEEKEDPDDVIYDGDVIRITSTYSEFLSQKDHYKEIYENSILELAKYVENLDKLTPESSEIIKLYQYKISIYAKLYHIANNIDTYKKYIQKAYDNMCEASRTNTSKKLIKIDRSIDRILKKVNL